LKPAALQQRSTISYLQSSRHTLRLPFFSRFFFLPASFFAASVPASDGAAASSALESSIVAWCGAYSARSSAVSATAAAELDAAEAEAELALAAVGSGVFGRPNENSVSASRDMRRRTATATTGTSPHRAPRSSVLQRAVR